MNAAKVSAEAEGGRLAGVADGQGHQDRIGAEAEEAEQCDQDDHGGGGACQQDDRQQGKHPVRGGGDSHHLPATVTQTAAHERAGQRTESEADEDQRYQSGGETGPVGQQRRDVGARGW
ncbi:hypothetical protein QMZ92_14435 [Streptomyces sp. HNM0645]|nr:hypothetical protein [Streptomyces sp. HNM0645]